MANEAQGVAATTSKEKSGGGGVPVRWPWLAVGVAGLLVPLLWLFLGRSNEATGGGANARSAPAPMAPGAMARPNIRLDSRAAPVEAGAVAAAPAPPAEPVAEAQEAKPAPVRSAEEKKSRPERAPAPAPATKDVARRDESAKTLGNIGGGERETAKPARTTRSKPPSRPMAAKPSGGPVAAGPVGPDPGAGLAPPAPPPAAPMAQGAPAPPPPAPRMAPGAVAPKPSAPRQRSLAAEMDDGVSEKKADADAPKPAPRENRGEGIGLGNPGTIGHGAVHANKRKEVATKQKTTGDKVGSKKRAEGGTRAGKGRGPAPPTPSPEAAPPEGSEGDEEVDSDLASLQPGWFGAKIPQQMNLNESSRVRVTVTREENKAKGRAKLEAMAPTHAPATVLEQDILVGKFIRVELRAFASEFEILAITSPEQRLIRGRVTTWEWAVVPRQPGAHELSVVVTNLTDGRGNPIDLTVHSQSVEVQVKTMQKLRDVASLLSSAMGGLMSLLGMYKGILAPLLSRRRERDGEGGGDKSKDKSKDKPKESEPESPQTSKTDTPPAVGASTETSKPAS